MIIRNYVACGTCNKNYMLRMQIGLREKQKHIFHCVSCNESIHITLDQNKGISLGENCVQVEESEDALPYYLSPDFVANADEIHDPHSFPAFRFMDGLIGKVKEAGLLNKMPIISDASMHPTWHLERIWLQLQKAWRLQDSKKFEISNPIISQFCIENEIDDHSLSDAQFFFINQITKLDEVLFSEVKEIRDENPKEFLKFIHYYQLNLRENHLRDFFTMLSDFFAAFSDFTQVFLYGIHGTSAPENPRATSVNFDSVKKFYANTYEFYAGAICIFTCLNNIKSKRDFNMLSKITLEKYLGTDKAERRNSIKENVIFSKATSEFDSTIRNASFHNWFILKENKHEIEYRTGGTGAIRTINYADYLIKCTALLRQVCQLFMLELLFDEHARNNALVTKLPNRSHRK